MGPAVSLKFPPLASDVNSAALNGGRGEAAAAASKDWIFCIHTGERKLDRKQRSHDEGCSRLRNWSLKRGCLPSWISGSRYTPEDWGWRCSCVSLMPYERRKEDNLLEVADAWSNSGEER